MAHAVKLGNMIRNLNIGMTNFAVNFTVQHNFLDFLVSLRDSPLVGSWDPISEREEIPKLVWT